MRGLLLPWTKSSIILISNEESVWRKWKLAKKTVSFAEDGLLTCFTNTSASMKPTILSKTVPTCSQSVHEMMTFRNSIRTGRRKMGPDYHRLKTMVKRSIEQEIRNKNFGIRNGILRRTSSSRTQGTKQRAQRILGDCWQWEANGQYWSGQLQFPPRCGQAWEKSHHQIRLRILSCSRMSENHRDSELPEERVLEIECLDDPAMIT